MTTKNTPKPEFFLFQVKPGFHIDISLEAKEYKRLANTLRTHGQSFNKFVLKDWFVDIDEQIPKTLTSEPNGKEICKLRYDVEEKDRPYFDTWIIWKNGQKPSKENLLKTLLILGESALQYSKKNDASARWSAVDLDRNWNAKV